MKFDGQSTLNSYHGWDSSYAVFESTGRRLDCSGRTLHVFEGIVGISLTGEGELYAGHDCGPYVDDYKPLTAKEEIELADYMIALWQQFKEERRGKEASS